MSGPTPKQIFILLMTASGVPIPEHIIGEPNDVFLTEVSALVIPLEGQQLVTTAMIMLNGPMRTDLPDGLVKPLNDKLVAVIYEKMPHPPRNLAAQDFRSADGADRLGAAVMPYAQNVLPGSKNIEYPDAQNVFDKLMLREQIFDAEGKRIGEKIVDNPIGLSSLTFAYGTLVIHSVFKSKLEDPSINETSSYFDLAPLYGDNIVEQMSVRNRTGRGRLAPDCFTDDRMLFLPPAAATLLVLFNRNHNYIADILLKNEKEARGWVDPPPAVDCIQREKQDEEIFQLARLINCVHFVNIVITDYVGGIMGRTADGGGWPLSAQPFDKIDLPDRAFTYVQDPARPLKATHVSRGDGNLVSTEFNTLYRWHSTLSKNDVEWAEDLLADVLGRRDFHHFKPADYIRAFRMVEPIPQDPKQRTFAGLVRNSDGYFDNKDLAKILFDATESPAGTFRANGTPLIMGFIDVRGIERARLMNTCTMNEFREWLGLPKFKSFEDWNKDPTVSQAASELYGDNIDRLELYPGLHAEGAAEDGTGNYLNDPLRIHTMRNGLLFDAIALIRGDRFFTTAFNEENYTHTGFNDVKRDLQNKAYGGCIHKILFRCMPGVFPENSVYSWFPMTTPKTMQAALEKRGEAGGWSFERPPLPESK